MPYGNEFDMFGGEPEIIDDPMAVEMANGYHAEDVPQDWAQANPYDMDMGVPPEGSMPASDVMAGMDVGMGDEMGGMGMEAGPDEAALNMMSGGPMEMGMDPGVQPEEAPMGPQDAIGMRDAMIGRMQSEGMDSSQYQDEVVADNMRQRKVGRGPRPIY